jgi:hypothetical protein
MGRDVPSRPDRARAAMCSAGLAVLLALLLPLGVARTASAKGRTTLVAGYVSAGAPVSGANLSVYGPSGRRMKLREKTDADGFFTLVLRGSPHSLRIVANGGAVGDERVDGSLQAIVRHPGPAVDVFVNPASTVTAVYAAGHPRASLALSSLEASRLLGLGPGDSIGGALLHVTPYFDGLAFLRAAQARGGLQRYVAYLIGRGKPVSFRPARLLGGIQDYARVLGMASNAISAVSGIGSIVNDVIGWAQGSQQQIGQIWDAVRQMQSQLTAIQTALDNIQAEIQSGFRQLHDQIGDLAYNQSVLGLKELAGTVATTESDFEDLVTNAASPNFSAALATAKTHAIEENINKLETGFNEAHDVFRDGLLGSLGTKPAYYFAGTTLLARSAHFMTPGDSTQLEAFASYVLQYQALAFNLIVRWETHLSPKSPTGTLTKAVKQYLGFASTDQAKAWLRANPPESPTPSAPLTGALHDELTYLATIHPVPTHMIVEEIGDAVTGPMWQASDAAPFDLGADVHARSGGMGCADRYHAAYSELGKEWCQYMWKSWSTAKDALTTAANHVATSSGLSGWQSATLGQAQALLRTDKVASVLQIKPDYWDPYDFALRTHGYQTTADGLYCDYYCGYRSTWVDGMDVTTVKGSPEGARATKGGCFFGVGDSKGTNCPLLYVLFRRTPASSEHYWPYLTAGAATRGRNGRSRPAARSFAR